MTSNNVHDQHAATESERDQDQPDLDAFAARMGTDQLDDRDSPATGVDDDTRDWRAPVSTALGGPLYADGRGT